MSNHVDRFYAAVAVLASHQNIKKRLVSAYEDHLEEIEDDELPIAVREGFADLRRVMHRVAPLNGEGTICASVRKMSRVEAGEVAQSILDLYREVLLSADDNQVDLPLDNDAIAVPAFLSKTG
ncbi:MAG: hypothetical protein AAF351_14895 [Pseudomonadota bacterium]